MDDTDICFKCKRPIEPTPDPTFANVMWRGVSVNERRFHSECYSDADFLQYAGERKLLVPVTVAVDDSLRITIRPAAPS